MKYFTAIILSLMFVLALTGCSQQENATYKVTIADSSFTLESELEERYPAGEEVTIKLPTVTEQYYTLSINGEEQQISSSNLTYTYFNFIMPSCDVIIEIETHSVDIPTEGPQNSIVSIVDRTQTEGLSYDTAMEKFFEDENNEYYFYGIYSQYIVVHYEDGSQEDIVTALNAGRAAMIDLDRFEIGYQVEAKLS